MKHLLLFLFMLPLVAFSQQSKDPTNRYLQSVTDYYFMVSRGEVNGATAVVITSHNPDIDAASNEDIWEGGGLLTYPADDDSLKITSTSASDSATGTGALTVLVTGLDTNYAALSETITLKGTDTVKTVNKYWRVRSMTVKTAGSSGGNVGNLTGTIGPSLQIESDATEATTKNIHYTVPASKKAYVVRGELSATKTGGGSPIVEFRGYVREIGGAWVLVFDKKIDTSVGFDFTFDQPVMEQLAAKTDFRIEVDTDVNNTVVYARIFIVEIAD